MGVENFCPAQHDSNVRPTP